MEEVLGVVDVVEQRVDDDLPLRDAEFAEPLDRLLDIRPDADVVIREADRRHLALRDLEGYLLGQQPPVQSLVEIYLDPKFRHLVEDRPPVRVAQDVVVPEDYARVAGIDQVLDPVAEGARPSLQFRDRTEPASPDATA